MVARISATLILAACGALRLVLQFGALRVAPILIKRSAPHASPVLVTRSTLSEMPVLISRGAQRATLQRNTVVMRMVMRVPTLVNPLCS
jgi:hypothetical protein